MTLRLRRLGHRARDRQHRARRRVVGHRDATTATAPGGPRPRSSSTARATVTTRFNPAVRDAITCGGRAIDDPRRPTRAGRACSSASTAPSRSPAPTARPRRRRCSSTGNRTILAYRVASPIGTAAGGAPAATPAPIERHHRERHRVAPRRRARRYRRPDRRRRHDRGAGVRLVAGYRRDRPGSGRGPVAGRAGRGPGAPATPVAPGRTRSGREEATGQEASRQEASRQEASRQEHQPPRRPAAKKPAAKKTSAKKPGGVADHGRARQVRPAQLPRAAGEGRPLPAARHAADRRSCRSRSTSPRSRSAPRVT